MRVFCRTNLDLVGEEWPTELPTIAVGQQIQSKTKHGEFQLMLDVVSVTWEYYDFRKEWCCVVELHDRKIFNRSIREFYEWYAPLVGRKVFDFI